MDYNVGTSVYCSLEVIGFHRWPDAPQEVRYLSDLHRHKFGIRVEIAVVEHDREIEFHMLRRQVESWVHLTPGHAEPGEDRRSVEGTGEVYFGAMSCEMIATSILEMLRLTYPGRSHYSVEVNEDGENGAIVRAAFDEVGSRMDNHLDYHRSRVERMLS